MPKPKNAWSETWDIDYRFWKTAKGNAWAQNLKNSIIYYDLRCHVCCFSALKLQSSGLICTKYLNNEFENRWIITHSCKFLRRLLARGRADWWSHIVVPPSSFRRSRKDHRTAHPRPWHRPCSTWKIRLSWYSGYRGYSNKVPQWRIIVIVGSIEGIKEWNETMKHLRRVVARHLAIDMNFSSLKILWKFG